MLLAKRILPRRGLFAFRNHELSGLEAGIVPDPPSRQGYYYVTAATYQGETRYGRKRAGGVLSGRDPAGLPRCTLGVLPAVESNQPPSRGLEDYLAVRAE
jgi:hypothetical protein